MKLWPWSVLERAKLAEAAAQIAKAQAKGMLDRAGNLWDESKDHLRDTEQAAASVDYRLPRAQGESVKDYDERVAAVFHDGRHSPVALATLDFLDIRRRGLLRLLLAEVEPVKAEGLRQRAAELADTRSALVATLYGKIREEHRKEAVRRLQDDRMIYTDVAANKT